jgi:cyclophilin family peptidyl-prolyl cis-trans isomerase
LKTFSLTRGVARTGSTDSFLPDYNTNIRSFYHDHEETIKSPQSAPRKPKRFSATENGRVDVLPTSSSYRDRIPSYDRASDLTNISHSFERSRMSRSSTFTESISKVWNGAVNSGRKEETLPLHSSQDHTYDDSRMGTTTPNNHVNSNKASLRSRRTRSITTDRDDISVEDCNTDRRTLTSRSGWLPWSSGYSGSDPSIRNTFKGGKRRSSECQEYLLPLRISSPVFTSSNGKRFNIIHYSKSLFHCNWIQMLIILAATGIIWHSYHRTQTIHTRLESFHDKESMSLLHLKTVEQQLVHLHENIVRLNDAASNVVNNNSGQSHSATSRKDAVDADLIRVQTQQLHQMEEELDHELRALQSKIQHVARSSIVSTYGEGPVQVVLELDFMDSEIRDDLPQGSNVKHNTISILLWHDVPHAAWTWLHQIRQGMWNNATLKLGKGSLSIDATPTEQYRQKENDVDDNSSLKFVEKSKKTHEPWTVGLTQTEFGTGMFINLQDNSALRNHDVCVGRVIDGFDALQLLVDVSRKLEGSTKSVAIKSAVGSHMTRSQSQGVI